MTSIEQLAKKFRQLADGLDDLLGLRAEIVNETSSVAAKIRKTLVTRKRKYTKRKATVRKTGFKYNGKHWKQKAKAKAKTRKNKKMHWTQRPENKDILHRMIKKAAQSKKSKKAVEPVEQEAMRA